LFIDDRYIRLQEMPKGQIENTPDIAWWQVLCGGGNESRSIYVKVRHEGEASIVLSFPEQIPFKAGRSSLPMEWMLIAR
jgi:hypothetical protein